MYNKAMEHHHIQQGMHLQKVHFPLPCYFTRGYIWYTRRFGSFVILLGVLEGALNRGEGSDRKGCTMDGMSTTKQPTSHVNPTFFPEGAGRGCIHSHLYFLYKCTYSYYHV